jgi:hypothetical protein
VYSTHTQDTTCRPTAVYSRHCLRRQLTVVLIDSIVSSNFDHQHKKPT